jgi:hypothetical protein
MNFKFYFVLTLILVGITVTHGLQQPQLTQRIKHATYTLLVPANWTYHLYGNAKERYSDPTVILHNASGKQVGILVELRIDDENPIEATFQHPTYNALLSRSKNARIYTGVEKDERYYCDESTGYTIYFKTKNVPFKLGLAIVKSWQMK